MERVEVTELVETQPAGLEAGAVEMGRLARTAEQPVEMEEGAVETEGGAEGAQREARVVDTAEGWGTTNTPGEALLRGKSYPLLNHALLLRHCSSPSGEETSLDKDVMSKEDMVVQSNQGLSLNTLTVSDIKLPLRPGYGQDGHKILLKTNYFKMTIDTSKQLFRYHVDVVSDRKKKSKAGESGKKEDPEPEVLGRRTMRRAFTLLFGSSDFGSHGDRLATDFVSTIITTKKLELGASGKSSFRVLCSEAEETVPRRHPTIYTFTISSLGTVPTTELLRYLASTTTDPSDFAGKDDAIQALNIIVARTPNFKPDVYQAGQNKFFQYPSDPKDYNDLSGGLIAVRGYYSSVRTSTMRTLLNLNAQCSPFYPAVNMVELMGQHSGFDERNWEALEKFIEKLRVKTRYLKNEDGSTDVRVKTVAGLSHQFEERPHVNTGKLQKFGNAKGDHGNAQQLSFDCEDFPNDKPISIERFFKKSKILFLFSASS